MYSHCSRIDTVVFKSLLVRAPDPYESRCQRYHREQWVFFCNHGTIRENLRFAREKMNSYHRMVANLMILHDEDTMRKAIWKLKGSRRAVLVVERTPLKASLGNKNTNDKGYILKITTLPLAEHPPKFECSQIHNYKQLNLRTFLNGVFFR
jgi:hypothetical protein